MNVKGPKFCSYRKDGGINAIELTVDLLNKWPVIVSFMVVSTEEWVMTSTYFNLLQSKPFFLTKFGKPQFSSNQPLNL